MSLRDYVKPYFCSLKIHLLATPHTYLLSELTAFIRRVFALNLPEAVWVTAELGQVNLSRGHFWLTLVEKGETGDIAAQLGGVVWSAQLRALRARYGLRLMEDVFTEGVAVRLQVTTTFHPRYGLRLTVQDIDPSFTLGELERQRQQVLQQLAAAGLLERNAALPFPVLPRRLAVISSETAAGLADFRQQLAENPFGYQFTVQLFTAAMQGAQTSEEVRRRLRQIAARAACFDVLVIIRGGGSRTDLAAFDEEELCRAVATFPLPVIVGIGHETDTSVLDRVASRSLKTPTAVAVFLAEQLLRAEQQVLTLGQQITRQARQHLREAQLHLSPIRAQVRQFARHALAHNARELERYEQQLKQCTADSLRQRMQQLEHLTQLLQALRPESTLARGYALASQQGKLLTSPEQIGGGEITLRLRDGTVLLEKGEEQPSD